MTTMMMINPAPMPRRRWKERGRRAGRRWRRQRWQRRRRRKGWRWPFAAHGPEGDRRAATRRHPRRARRRATRVSAQKAAGIVVVIAPLEVDDEPDADDEQHNDCRERHLRAVARRCICADEAARDAEALVGVSRRVSAALSSWLRCCPSCVRIFMPRFSVSLAIRCVS